VKAELAEAAAARDQTILDYISDLVATADECGLHDGLSNNSQSFVTAKTADADAIRDIAVKYDKRQWEVLYELHRRAKPPAGLTR
jgi:hypothetical protein